MFSETSAPADTGRAPARSTLAQWAPHTHDAACSSWPTPKARDADRGGLSEERLLALMDSGRSGRDLTDAVGGPTNPTWAEWLYGLSGRVDRTRALGAAVVPAVAEHIGRLILDAQVAS